MNTQEELIEAELRYMRAMYAVFTNFEPTEEQWQELEEAEACLKKLQEQQP